MWGLEFILFQLYQMKEDVMVGANNTHDDENCIQNCGHKIWREETLSKPTYKSGGEH